MTRTSKVKGFGEVIAYLPYQLGFRPRDAVVLIGWEANRMGLTVHVDGSADEAFGASLPGIERGLRSAPHDSVSIVAYADGGRPPVLEPLMATVRRTGLPIGHLAVVEADHWRVEKCCCAGCPREWTAVPPAQGVAAVADRVLAGAAPLASRAELIEQMSRSAPVDRAWTGRIQRGRPAVAAALADWLRGTTTVDGGAVSPSLVTAIRSLHDKRWRDAVLCSLAPHEFPPTREETPWYVAVLTPFEETGDWPDHDDVQWTMIRSLAHIPQRHQPPVLTLIAGNAWAHGGGALATIAIGRALTLDPDYRLAQLIGQLIFHGVRGTEGGGRLPDQLGA